MNRSDIKIVGFSELPEDTAGVEQLCVNPITDELRTEWDGYFVEEHEVFGSGISVVPRTGLRVVSYFDFISSRNAKFLVAAIREGLMGPVLFEPSKMVDVTQFENLHGRLAIAAALVRGFEEPA